MILLSLTRQSVSIPWPWVSLKFYQVRHGSLFLKEAQGQMDKLNKFVHSLATVFFYLVEKGSCYCLRCFGWMQANFTLFSCNFEHRAFAFVGLSCGKNKAVWHYKLLRSALFNQHKGTLCKASGWNLKDHSCVQDIVCFISIMLSSVLLPQQP